MTNTTTQAPAPALSYHPHQREGYVAAALAGRCILADEQGLGKTWALFSVPAMQRARLVLIVADGGLHKQIKKEGADLFGVTVRDLPSQKAACADPLISSRMAGGPLPEPDTRTLADGSTVDLPTYYITSYTALGGNGADERPPKTINRMVNGEKFPEIKWPPAARTLRPKTLEHIQRHCGGSPQFDTAGIGLDLLECNPKIEADLSPGAAYALRQIKCWHAPSLATLVRDVFDSVVCDEGVRVKGDDTLIATGVRTMQSENRLILSGTPAKNNLGDIFHLASWVSGSDEASARWPYKADAASRAEFMAQHMVIEENLTQGEKRKRRVTKYRNEITQIHRLWKILGPIVIRHRKADVCKDLVPKTTKPIRVRPGTQQLRAYQWQVENEPTINSQGAEMNPVAAIGCQLTKLRTAALAPDAIALANNHEPPDFDPQRDVPITGGKTEDKNLFHQFTAPDGKQFLVQQSINAGPGTKGEPVWFAYIDQKIVAQPWVTDPAAEIDEDDTAFHSEEAAYRWLRDRRDAIARNSRGSNAQLQKLARSGTMASPKTAAIYSLVTDALQQGKQIPIGSHSTEFSRYLESKLSAAGVSVIRLDGDMSPTKRGQGAAAFKRFEFSVAILGKCMSEGFSFEQCDRLITTSLDWAFDINAQLEERVHRLNSPGPVTIFPIITEGTIDERMSALYAEKSDASSLAIDAAIFQGNEEDFDVAKLLREAIEGFDPDTPTIDEPDIEAAWDDTAAALSAAETKFRATRATLAPPAQQKAKKKSRRKQPAQQPRKRPTAAKPSKPEPEAPTSAPGARSLDQIVRLGTGDPFGDRLPKQPQSLESLLADC